MLARGKEFRSVKLVDIWEDPNMKGRELRYRDVYQKAKELFPEITKLTERTFIRYLQSLVKMKLLHRRVDKKRRTFYKPAEDAFKEKTKNDMLEAIGSAKTYHEIDFDLEMQGVRKPLVGPFVLPRTKIIEGIGVTKNRIFANRDKEVNDQRLFFEATNFLLFNPELFLYLILSSLPKNYLKEEPISNTVYLTLKIKYEIPNLEKLLDACRTYYHFIEAKLFGLKRRGFRSTHEELLREAILPTFRKVRNDIETALKK